MMADLDWTMIECEGIETMGVGPFILSFTFYVVNYLQYQRSMLGRLGADGKLAGRTHVGRPCVKDGTHEEQTQR